MSHKTVWTCDKCKNEFVMKGGGRPNQYWTIKVMVDHDGISKNYSYPHMTTEVCRPCLETFGIYVTKKPDEEDSPNLPSIEDAIREIVRQCLPVIEPRS